MEQGTRESEQVAAKARQLRSWCAGRGCARTARLAPAIAVVLALASGVAHASQAELSFDVTTVSFPSADPDLAPTIGAAENPVQVRVVVKGQQPSSPSQLTVQAVGDLLSGSDSIPVGQVTWTAQGQGFVSGTLSKTQPELVGQWLWKVDATGQLRFWLQNSWSYAVGAYSQNLVYTLIAY